MLLVILVIKGYAGIGWDLIKYDWCPYEKKKIPDEWSDTQGKYHVTIEAEIRDAASSQGRPRINSHSQRLGIGKRAFYSESQREHLPVDSLTFDF